MTCGKKKKRFNITEIMKTNNFLYTGIPLQGIEILEELQVVITKAANTTLVTEFLAESRWTHQ